MVFKGYELIRTVNGNAVRWHVTDETGHRLTRLGFRTKTEAKRFCMERDINRIGRR